MGIEDVVNGTAVETPPVVETPTEVVPEVATPEAPVETPAEELKPEAPVESPKEGQTVPLAVMLDMRDERNRYKAEAESLRKPADAPKVPDPYDDPDGFKSHLEVQFDRKLTARTFEISDLMARQAHGAETVEAATEWALDRAKSDPVFANQYMGQTHPIDWIVRQHKRESLVGQLPDDVSSLDELIEREIAKRGLSAAAPAVEQQQAPATPARSLASQRSSGGAVKDVPTGPLAALESLFPA